MVNFPDREAQSLEIKLEKFSSSSSQSSCLLHAPLTTSSPSAQDHYLFPQPEGSGGYSGQRRMEEETLLLRRGLAINVRTSRSRCLAQPFGDTHGGRGEMAVTLLLSFRRRDFPIYLLFIRAIRRFLETSGINVPCKVIFYKRRDAHDYKITVERKK